ncbi:hypothetical protein CUMW_179950 [Citrus unshiu]|uniref:Uncharacterized protein n=1 Tax=Citrus unshiu TaxID=55188 RepID=A0A2H5PYP9_CITUN|nr:hypothetical protein CUMW_179950 [Citrus unshiu]
MMMRHPRPAGTTTQYRHLETNGYDLLSLNYNRNGFDGVLRKDHYAVVAAKLERLWWMRSSFSVLGFGENPQSM